MNVDSHLFSKSERIIVQEGRRANGCGEEIERVERWGRVEWTRPVM